jgi:small subunit ribosomal protein S6
MPLYEHIFLARQDISQQQVEALIKEFADVVTAGNGKIGKTEYWGLKNLAYKIKKNRKAHYVLMNLDSPPAAIAEMERRMGLSTDILRWITIRVEQHETEMSVQMRKQDRDERDDRGGGRGGFGGRGGDRGGRGFGGGGGRGGDRPPRGDRPPAADRGTFRPRPAGPAQE